MPAKFSSLRTRNFRIWSLGALVSNIGTWMQRIGQGWLVLTALTDHSATAVGTVMALQLGPPLLLLPLTGYAADHFDRQAAALDAGFRRCGRPSSRTWSRTTSWPTRWR